MTSHFQNPGEAHGEGTVKAVKATDSAAGLSQNLSEICGKQSLEFCSKSRSGCLATKGRQKTLSIESIGCPSVVFTVAIRGLYPSQGGPRSQDWPFQTIHKCSSVQQCKDSVGKSKTFNFEGQARTLTSLRWS